MKKINIIAQFETYHIDDIERSRKLPIIINIIRVGILLLTFFGIHSFYNNNYLLGIIETATVIILAALFILVSQTKNSATALIVIPIMFGVFFTYVFCTGAGNNSGHLWSLLFPPIIMYLVGSRQGLMLCIIYAGISLTFYFSNLTIDYNSSFISRYIGAFAAMTAMSFFMEDTRTRMQQRIFIKNQELSEIVAKLEKKDLELKETLLHYKTLFESSGEAIFILDGLNIIDCNPFAVKLFRCDIKKLISKQFHEFVVKKSPVDIKKILKEKLRKASGGKQIIFNLNFRSCGKEIFLAEVKLNKMELSGNERILCNIRDITNQKNAEQALVQAKEKAENSEKMKGDFLAQMSHEIRTPINTILNYTSLLKMEFEDKLIGDFKGSFVSIQNAANRLLRTIDMILGISEIESGAYTARYEKIDLVNQVVIPVINEFKREALQKELSLNFNNEIKDQIFIFADFYSVYQLAANLIHNSIKYTLEGSVTLTVLQKDDRTELLISDTGIGIAEQYLPHLFEKFTQEEEGYTRKFEGSGLGLALVKQYGDINKAAISVASKKGKGTTFTISFSSR